MSLNFPLFMVLVTIVKYRNLFVKLQSKGPQFCLSFSENSLLGRDFKVENFTASGSLGLFIRFIN